AERYVSTIIDSAHTAGKLVDGLLGFSQTGRISLSKRPVAINDLVQDCLRVLEPDMKDRDIEWTIGDLGRAVGDANMFRQVFQNLLSNAIKYSRTREVAKISVRREMTASEIVFSVSDNGVGFDMRYIDKLFGVFQRLHRMEEFEGTGIGLANVKRIAQRHGGRAWAEGRLGEGATFYFSIPKHSE
ncbi:MAG: GHKL domain-containing protein, partial [Alcaligenaceae bacterium]